MDADKFENLITERLARMCAHKIATGYLDPGECVFEADRYILTALHLVNFPQEYIDDLGIHLAVSERRFEEAIRSQGQYVTFANMESITQAYYVFSREIANLIHDYKLYVLDRR